MRNVVEAQLDVQMFHRRGDTSGFIARWDDDTKELEGRLLSRRGFYGGEGGGGPVGFRCGGGGNFFGKGGKGRLCWQVKMGRGWPLFLFTPRNVRKWGAGVRVRAYVLQ